MAMAMLKLTYYVFHRVYLADIIGGKLVLNMSIFQGSALALILMLFSLYWGMMTHPQKKIT